ncbi:MAG: NAD(P)/FAD-dependent oxidoreductase [Nevskia sp.]|nr:NAD(P)/FAD-dependent oxidoreductase [Nevskia sp.]
MNTEPLVDVLVIGAGPAGAMAAALSRKHGLSVRMLEKTRFPRFSIGESLLPQSLVLLEEAGMLEAVEKAGFQYKDGAQIVRGERKVDFEFSMKTCAGHPYAYQVTRADFDLILAEEARRMGADLRYEQEITAVDFSGEPAVVVSRDAQGGETVHHARFVFDASGFGRILPRLLDLDRPADFPVRASLFMHVEDRIVDADFDRNKIRVAVHPEHEDIWYWLIPFSQGRASIGVVAEDKVLQSCPGDLTQRFDALVAQEPGMKRMLRNARPLWPSAREIRGYATAVSSLHGRNFVLLGNAGKFLDPVFSSGVTIALKSAALAVPLAHRQLQGATVDWEAEFAEPLMLGVDTFKGYVETWYEGALQTVMFSDRRPPRVYELLCSVLAGYAWDTENPYVGQSGRRLRTLAQLIRSEEAGGAGMG